MRLSYDAIVLSTTNMGLAIEDKNGQKRHLDIGHKKAF